MQSTKTQVMDYLTEVKDPEIPVLNVVEMGIVRDVLFEEDGLHVTITPTYSGCPAMQTISDDIVSELERRNMGPVHVDTVFAPAWTTEWITEEARDKMRDFGISPPGKPCANPLDNDPEMQVTACPYCGSSNTSMRSEFGSTACKSLHMCQGCTQPFEHFKCI